MERLATDEDRGVMYGGSVPRGGIPSGNPVAITCINLAKAIARGGEDQRENEGSSDGTTRSKQCFAHSRGGHPWTACGKVSSSPEYIRHVGRTGTLAQVGL